VVGRGLSQKTCKYASPLAQGAAPAEPEGVATGRVAGTPYAFLASERSGSIFAFDLSDPSAPLFSGYANTRPADLGPEVIAFVRAGDSPSGNPLLLVANEISGTLNVLEVNG
jgi:2',3'-cyclic-nucleotide 2'-phosphodiesterase/3'-nucleotidase/5'-nucleotidase